MSNYKVIRNSTGNLVCYGPNDNNYEPTVATGNVLTIEATLPSASLAETKATQISKINQSADAAFNAITSSYPKHEVDTWPSQLNEAKAYKLDALAPTPTIDAIVTASGLTKLAVADGIIAKAALFHAMAGQIVGKRRKLTTQIEVATTNAAVEAVV